MRVSGSIAYLLTPRHAYAVALLLQFLLDLLLRVHVVNGVRLETLQVLHDDHRLLVDLVLEVLRGDALVHLQLLQVAVAVAAEVLLQLLQVAVAVAAEVLLRPVVEVHRHLGKGVLLLAGGIAAFLVVADTELPYETLNLVRAVEVLVEHLDLINTMESVEDDVPDMDVVHEINSDPLNALQLYKNTRSNSRDFSVASSYTEVKGKGLDETTVSQVI